MSELKNMNMDALGASLKMLDKKAEMAFEAAKLNGTLDPKQEKLSSIFNNVDALVKLSEAETVEEAQAVFASFGLEMSVEEVDNIGDQIADIANKLVANGGELSEDELEDVAGGFAIEAASAGAAAGSAVCPGIGTAIGAIVGPFIAYAGIEGAKAIWNAYGDEIIDFAKKTAINLGKKAASKAWGWLKKKLF